MARKADALPLATRRQTTAVLAVSTRTLAELEAAGTVKAARPRRGGRPSLYNLTAGGPPDIPHPRPARPPASDPAAPARPGRAPGAPAQRAIAQRPPPP